MVLFRPSFCLLCSITLHPSSLMLYASSSLFQCFLLYFSSHILQYDNPSSLPSLVMVHSSSFTFRPPFSSFFPATFDESFRCLSSLISAQALLSTCDNDVCCVEFGVIILFENAIFFADRRIQRLPTGIPVHSCSVHGYQGSTS